MTVLHYDKKDFGKIRKIKNLGTDFPKLPATTLLDDINKVIFEIEALRLKPEYHSYKVYAYPSISYESPIHYLF